MMRVGYAVDNRLLVVINEAEAADLPIIDQRALRQGCKEADSSCCWGGEGS